MMKITVLLIMISITSLNATDKWYKINMQSFTIPQLKVDVEPTLANSLLIAGGLVVAVVGAGVLVPTLGIAAGTGAIATTMIGTGVVSAVNVEKKEKNK